MQLRDHTDVTSRALIDRNDRLHAKLAISPGPDNAGIDRVARLSSRAAVQRSFENIAQQSAKFVPTRLAQRNTIARLVSTSSMSTLSLLSKDPSHPGLPAI